MAHKQSFPATCHQPNYHKECGCTNYTKYQTVVCMVNMHRAETTILTVNPGPHQACHLEAVLTVVNNISNSMPMHQEPIPTQHSKVKYCSDGNDNVTVVMLNTQHINHTCPMTKQHQHSPERIWNQSQVMTKLRTTKSQYEFSMMLRCTCSSCFYIEVLGLSGRQRYSHTP